MNTTEPISTEGYTYFSIYRAHAIYVNPKAERYTYAAGRDDRITVFDVGFSEIQAQLDEITRNGTKTT
jgi:hypothetical protein